ncbi:MAG: ABC transporter substrate-binding protein, partial [Advenella sp.]
MKKFLPCLLGVALAASAHSVFAEDATVNVGVVVSATGPAASLGIAERNTVALLPRQIGSTKVNYTILDDATDATQAVRNMRKLISENNADV